MLVVDGYITVHRFYVVCECIIILYKKIDKKDSVNCEMLRGHF